MLVIAMASDSLTILVLLVREQFGQIGVYLWMLLVFVAIVFTTAILEKLFESEAQWVARSGRRAFEKLVKVVGDIASFVASRDNIAIVEPSYRAFGPFREIDGRFYGCVLIGGGFEDESITVCFVDLPANPWQHHRN